MVAKVESLITQSHSEQICYDKRLQLPSLVHQQLRCDMILLFKVVNSYFGSGFKPSLSMQQLPQEGI